MLFDLVDAYDAVLYNPCLLLVAVVLAVQHIDFVLQGGLVVLGMFELLEDVVQLKGRLVVEGTRTVAF